MGIDGLIIWPTRVISILIKSPDPPSMLQDNVPFYGIAVKDLKLSYHNGYI